MASEKPSAAAPAAAAEGKDAPKKKGGLKMIIAAVAVVVLEVATVGVTMSLSSGPRKVIAEVPVNPQAEKIERDAEVKVIQERLPNLQSGRLQVYDLQVVVKVSEKNKVKVTDLLSERDAQIRDHLRTIMASSDPQSLTEPGLETVRRQIGYQLEQDLGKELIKEVLIPRCGLVPGLQ